MSWARLLGVGTVAAATLVFLCPSGEQAAPAATDVVAELQAYLGEHPDDARSWAVLGRSYLDRARASGDSAYHAKAQGAFERSLKLTANPDALLGMGVLANARHDFIAALAWGRKTLAADSFRSGAHGVLTDALVELGRYGEAQRALDKMLAMRPDVASFTRAAHLLSLRGRHAEAEHALTRAIGAATDPADLAFCHYQRGELRWNLGDLDGAGREFALARENPLGQAGLARVLAARGRTAEALDAYAAAIAVSPAFFLEYGELLESAGRKEAAEQQYALLRAQHKLLRAAGSADDLTAGLLEADHGDPALAVRMLRAEWQRRRSVDVADALGWALHRAGRDGEAIRFARAADRLGGTTPLRAFHRGEIERGLGHRAAALAHLRRATPLTPLQAAEARRALATF